MSVSIVINWFWIVTQNGEAILQLQKRIYQIQTDLLTAQSQAEETNNKLETTNKALQTVSGWQRSILFHSMFCLCMDGMNERFFVYIKLLA